MTQKTEHIAGVLVRLGLYSQDSGKIESVAKIFTGKKAQLENSVV